jgi:hypothetical protein
MLAAEQVTDVPANPPPLRSFFHVRCPACEAWLHDDGVWRLCLDCGFGWKRTVKGLTGALEWMRTRGRT